MIKFKNWVKLYEDEDEKNMETDIEGLDKYDNFLELMNMFIMQQYELSNFTINYDYDHSLYIEPEHFEDINEFINKISKEYANIASVNMGYRKNAEIGSMTISILKSKITVFVSKKKELTRQH